MPYSAASIVTSAKVTLVRGSLCPYLIMTGKPPSFLGSVMAEMRGCVECFSANVLNLQGPSRYREFSLGPWEDSEPWWQLEVRPQYAPSRYETPFGPGFEASSAVFLWRWKCLSAPSLLHPYIKGRQSSLLLVYKGTCRVFCGFQL
jgi:hypothetical protein